MLTRTLSSQSSETLAGSSSAHLHHQKPKVLYKLWFYVSLPPEYDFETPRFHYTIKNSDGIDPNHDWHNTEFITVEHNSGLKAHQEVILLGRETDAKWKFNYTIHSLKKPADYGTSKPEVDTVQPGITRHQSSLTGPSGIAHQAGPMTLAAVGRIWDSSRGRSLTIRMIHSQLQSSHRQ